MFLDAMPGRLCTTNQIARRWTTEKIAWLVNRITRNRRLTSGAWTRNRMLNTVTAANSTARTMSVASPRNVHRARSWSRLSNHSQPAHRAAYPVAHTHQAAPEASHSFCQPWPSRSIDTAVNNAAAPIPSISNSVSRAWRRCWRSISRPRSDCRRRRVSATAWRACPCGAAVSTRPRSTPLVGGR